MRYSVRWSRAGFPVMTHCPSGNDLVTIEPAPTIALGPKTTPGKRTLFIPIHLHFLQGQVIIRISQVMIGRDDANVWSNIAPVTLFYIAGKILKMSSRTVEVIKVIWME